MDKDTFCEQIRLHEKAMYDLAFSLVRNDTDAADIISEAILRAYKNLNSLKEKIELTVNSNLIYSIDDVSPIIK